jgi:hypothetical protein
MLRLKFYIFSKKNFLSYGNLDILMANTPAEPACRPEHSGRSFGRQVKLIQLMLYLPAGWFYSWALFVQLVPKLRDVTDKRYSDEFMFLRYGVVLRKVLRCLYYSRRLRPITFYSWKEIGTMSQVRSFKTFSQNSKPEKK